MLGKIAHRIFEKWNKFPSIAVLDREKLIGKARERLKELATKKNELLDRKLNLSFQVLDLILVQNHQLSSAIKGKLRYCYMTVLFRVKSIKLHNLYVLEDPKT